MSQIWMSHVADINESCRRYEWVRSYVRMYEWVMSHIWKVEWLLAPSSLSHIWMSHVADMNESCRRYEWLIRAVAVRVVKVRVAIAVAIRADPCGCTNTLQMSEHLQRVLYVKHNLFICETWLSTLQHTLQQHCNNTATRTATHVVSHNTLTPLTTARIDCICATWLIHICDMSHMCDMTHSYVRHDSFVWATWLIHMCDMTHSYVRHDSFVWATCLICATWSVQTRLTVMRDMCSLCHTLQWVTLYFIMCDTSRYNMWHDSL